MEVTKKNFEVVLPEIEESIETCSFLAIDCEMTGISASDEKENYFETVEERYLNVRESASRFTVVQFGLCPFFYDSETNEYTHKAYNFYTFPHTVGHVASNSRFLSESSSLSFLASCGFDFNKWIYDGIPYLTYTKEEELIKDLEKRQAFYASEENNEILSVPENLKSFMEEAEHQVKLFKMSDLTDFDFSNLTAYQRKLIFHNIKFKYPELYFETKEIKDEDATEEKIVAENNENGNTSTKTTPNRETHSSRVLRVTKLTTEQKEMRESQKKKNELENVAKSIGFSKVIRKIHESGKIVVGHNMLLDITHTIHQFIDDLPDNLPDFKILVQNTFPNIIDTKLMSSTYPFRELISSTVLFELVKQLQVEPFGLPPIGKLPDMEEHCYAIDDKKKHEAGFDAFITGACFIGMCKYLGTLQNPKKSRVLPDSPLVMPFLNKLFMMRMVDLTYLNISGTDLTPSRSHVFFVTCPKNANSKNIQNIFSPFGTVQLWWQTQTSLFVSLNDKYQAALVMLNVQHEPGYQVIPFLQYQKTQAEKKRPLVKEIKDALPGRETTSPEREQKNKRPKTEAD